MLACPRSAPPLVYTACAAPGQGFTWTTFHGGNDRLGWNRGEITLTPATVGGASFGLAWSSALFDPLTLSGTTLTGRANASPL